jgi:hypothetical protein
VVLLWCQTSDFSGVTAVAKITDSSDYSGGKGSRVDDASQVRRLLFPSIDNRLSEMSPKYR